MNAYEGEAREIFCLVSKEIFCLVKFIFLLIVTIKLIHFTYLILSKKAFQAKAIRPHANI